MTIDQSASTRLSPDELARVRELVAGSLDGLVFYARTRCQSPEDAVQEALMELVRQSPLPEDLMGWLYQAVRWRADSQRRTDTRRAKHIEHAAQTINWFANNDSPSSEITVDAEDLQVALESLPELEREIVVLKVWGNRTIEQIAAQCGVSKSKVHRLYWSAIHVLRKKLEALDSSTTTAKANTASSSDATPRLTANDNSAGTNQTSQNARQNTSLHRRQANESSR